MSSILDQYGRPFQGTKEKRLLRARYDMAQTTPENTRHWAAADGLSADAANSPAVRRILRNRARYEVAHNGYLRSIVRKRANQVIGHGPRLQILGEGRDAARFIENEFAEWCDAVGWAEKLHLSRRVRSVDGESFILLTSSRRLPTPVKLQLRCFEPERCTTPGLSPLRTNQIDGIDLDSSGDPVVYHVLVEHPGGSSLFLGAKADQISSRFILHSFYSERPEQHRGVCEILTALPLGAQLRRYTLATLTAAEVAALLSVILESDAEPDQEDAPSPFETLELDRGMMTVSPMGWKAKQLAAEQPTTVYPDFKSEIVSEMGAGDAMPAGLARGHSKDLNFASGRLDNLPWHLEVEIDQKFEARRHFDPILAAWLDEARSIPGYLPTLSRPMPRRQWIPRGIERGTDETKSANARDTNLKNGSTTYARESAKDGLDWEEQQEQSAAEHGITVEDYRKRLLDWRFGSGNPQAEQDANARLVIDILGRLEELEDNHAA